MIMKTLRRFRALLRGITPRKATSLTLGESVNIHSELAINAGHVRIGDFTYIGGPGRISSLPDTRITIGKYTAIASGIQIIGALHNSHIANYPVIDLLPKGSNVGIDHGISRGDITIGNDVWIGANVIVLSNVHIGDGAIVGAGAVVTKDVPPYAVVAGVPAKVKKMRFEDADIQILRSLKWWDWEKEKILESAPLFYDKNLTISEFICRTSSDAAK